MILEKSFQPTTGHLFPNVLGVPSYIAKNHRESEAAQLWQGKCRQGKQPSAIKRQRLLSLQETG